MAKSKEKGKISRRDFLKAGAAAGTMAVVTACAPRLTPTPTPTPAPTTPTPTATPTPTPTPTPKPTVSPTPTPTPTPAPTPTPTPAPAASPVFDALQFFNRNEAAIVHAAAGRIIPGTAQDPGAREAGAVVFIDRALEGYDIGLQPLYTAGVPGIEAYAQGKYKKGFAELTDQQQDDILSNMEKNSAEAKQYLSNPAGFFGTLVTHVRQGTFSDPVYGGNRNAVGWKLEGHPGIVFGRDPAQQKCDVNFQKEYMGAQDYYAGHPA